MFLYLPVAKEGEKKWVKLTRKTIDRVDCRKARTKTTTTITWQDTPGSSIPRKTYSSNVPLPPAKKNRSIYDQDCVFLSSRFFQSSNNLFKACDLLGNVLVFFCEANKLNWSQFPIVKEVENWWVANRAGGVKVKINPSSLSLSQLSLTPQQPSTARNKSLQGRRGLTNANQSRLNVEQFTFTCSPMFVKTKTANLDCQRKNDCWQLF
jgi:hypothetical protein